MPFQPLRMARPSFASLVKLTLLWVLLLGLSACGVKSTQKEDVELPPLVVVQKPMQCVNLVAVGDVMLGGAALPVMREKGYDYAFSGTKKTTVGADVALANLETALTNRGKAADKKFTFRNPADKMIPALKNAGFDLVSLANNHTVDYGVVGLKDTLDALNKGALPAVGAGMNVKQARSAYIMQVNGQTLGFLGYSLTYPEEFWATSRRAGTAFGHAAHIKRDVAKLKKKVDHVVVQFHWGREATTKLRYYQPSLGRLAIDSGATLIIGHHPHVLQGMERYKNGLIYYSLGNFAFGSYSNRSQTGGMAKVSLCKEGIKDYQLGVLDVNNYRVKFRPKWVSPKVLQSTLNMMRPLSKTMDLSIKKTEGGTTFLQGSDKSKK